MSLHGKNRAHAISKSDKIRLHHPPLDLIEPLSSIPCPSDSGFEDEEWKVLMHAFRYTGARLGELCGLRAENVVMINDIPIIRVRLAIIPLVNRGKLCDGFKTIPVHKNLEKMLFARARLIKSGEMFPRSGRSHVKFVSRSHADYGHNFIRFYLRGARDIWSEMHVHSWRSHVAHYLIRVAGVPEDACAQIIGHARGGPGSFSMEYLYRIINKLP